MYGQSGPEAEVAVTLSVVIKIVTIRSVSQDDHVRASRANQKAGIKLNDQSEAGVVTTPSRV